MDLLKLRDAAERLSISYPTLKQWIYDGKVHTVKTAGGHHRVPSGEIDRLTSRVAPPGGEMHVSGRNQLHGTVRRVKIDGLLAEVTLDIGGQVITSIITSKSARDLELRKGVTAIALIKSTEVMIMRGDL